MAQEATGTARANPSTSVAELARFFPEATPVRIPVRLARAGQGLNGQEPSTLDSNEQASSGQSSGTHSSASAFSESTVIEFGTSREVLFACATPLEFADVLRLRNADGSLDTEASVVAVQYHPGKTVVAARFLKEVPNWIVKP
ncbi:MAG: hypothetical protein WB562_12890 [Candidatus Sulfotelmatobacter sp.]